MNRLTPRERWTVVGLMVVLAVGSLVRYIRGNPMSQSDPETTPAQIQEE